MHKRCLEETFQESSSQDITQNSPPPALNWGHVWNVCNKTSLGCDKVMWSSVACTKSWINVSFPHLVYCTAFVENLLGLEYPRWQAGVTPPLLWLEFFAVRRHILSGVGGILCHKQSKYPCPYCTQLWEPRWLAREVSQRTLPTST